MQKLWYALNFISFYWKSAFLCSILQDSDIVVLMIFQIRKMDLEARSLQANIKAVLLAKLREYKSDLNNIKSTVKKIESGNFNPSARDELLESGMADVMTV